MEIEPILEALRRYLTAKPWEADRAREAYFEALDAAGWAPPHRDSKMSA